MDSPALEIGNSRDFGEIRNEVHRLVHAIDPGHPMENIDRAFAVIEAACRGTLPGYSCLLTPYHDQGHMLEVVLCSARLLHGLHLGGTLLDALTIDACLIGALLHDVGYLMRSAEARGSGAQFTLTHVVRGVVFAEEHFPQLPPDLMQAIHKVILATDHRPVAVMPDFDTPQERLAAQVTATADLVGQMSNREYLERLLLLYLEFREGGINIFKDVDDLLEKTNGFYKLMAARLDNELGGLAPQLRNHFDKTRGVGRNYYLESVERNLDYLRTLLRMAPDRRLALLRRGGIVAQALELLTRLPGKP